ncbi:trehalose-phosphatase [Phenylobacterium sp.]|uniref:trehalose-phosphatase n=1 Tax=Phenylobacterium sp. TaxID=1871053 RepID=UPI0030F44A2D
MTPSQIRPHARTPGLPVASTALFLDFDGTLAPIARRPTEIENNPSLNELLRQAQLNLHGRLALVSGRDIGVIDRMIEGAATCVAGEHGLQRRTPHGEVQSLAAHPSLPDAMEAFAAMARAHKGLVVEHKSASVALHYRLAPSAEEAVLDLAERVSASTGLTLQAGSMVVELRSPGPDKGAALRAYMAEVPFRGATPIFIGDDLTDEAAFEAAESFGGFGVIVGERRPTRAQYRIAGPPRVLDWISRSLESSLFEPGDLRWEG